MQRKQKRELAAKGPWVVFTNDCLKREVKISKGLRGKREKGKISDDLDEKDVEKATLKAS